MCLQDTDKTYTGERDKRDAYWRRRAYNLEKQLKEVMGQLKEVTGERDALLEKVS